MSWSRAIRSVDADLDLVGYGSVEADLRQATADLPPGKVVSSGPISDPDLVPLVQRSIATVLPSRQMEGIPYAVLQSFAYARAVVGTAVGALPDVIDDGRTGMIVPPNDPPAMAAALTSLVLDRPGADRMGATARGVVLERHAPRRYLAGVEAVYAKALGANPPRSI